MKIIRSALLYSLAWLCTLASVAPPAEADSARGVTAITDRGPIRGVQTASGSQFLGIPYAAAPTGELRFRPPQPHASWRTPRAAEAFGNACPQINPFTQSATNTAENRILIVTASSGLLDPFQRRVASTPR